MIKLKQRIANPMTVIAIFATLSETSAAISLPFLDDDERDVYIWFLISFPFYLIFLFFLTLNFNYRSLYAPSDFEKGKHFIKAMDTNERAETENPKKPTDETRGKKRTDVPGQPCPHNRFSAQHYVQLPVPLRDLHIIDARRMEKKTDFRNFMEQRIEAKRDTAQIVVFLIATESEKLLKKWLMKYSKNAQNRMGSAFCIAYNLSSHDVTVIDQACQADTQRSVALEGQ